MVSLWSGKSFSSVKLKDGGGSRRYSFERNAKLDKVYQKLKDIYFPNGKNTKKGYLVNLDCNMCDLNLENVNLNAAPYDYIRNNGFKYCKLILKTKKKTFLKDLSDTSSDKDEFKFEEIFKKKDQSKKYRQQQSMSAPTNSNSHFHNATKVLMVIVIDPTKTVLEKISHGKVQDEKRVILVLSPLLQTFQQRLPGRVNQGHQMLERGSS